MNSKYVCNVLSPRSDSVQFSTKTSESGQYSRVRYNENDCIKALGSDGNNVCSLENSQRYLLHLTGVSSDSTNCYDLNLSNNYRFCLGAEVVSEISSIAPTTFPTSAPQPITDFSGSTFLYFVNGEGLIEKFLPFFNPGEDDELFTDFISDNEASVYVIAKGSGPDPAALYRYAVGSNTGAPEVLAAGGTLFVLYKICFNSPINSPTIFHYKQ